MALVSKGHSVESLVGRIHSNLIYQEFTSATEIAALYAEVIAKGHVFNDANKRTALISMLTFLDLNGYMLIADQNEMADRMVDLAEVRLIISNLLRGLRRKFSIVR